MANRKDVDDIMEEQKKAESMPENELLTCKVVFKKPYRYLANTFDSMEFDFSTLTGADDIAAQAELRAHKIYSVVPATVPEYLAIMAARACTNRVDGARVVSDDTIKNLPIRVYNTVISKVRSFLLSQE